MILFNEYIIHWVKTNIPSTFPVIKILMEILYIRLRDIFLPYLETQTIILHLEYYTISITRCFLINLNQPDFKSVFRRIFTRDWVALWELKNAFQGWKVFFFFISLIELGKCKNSYLFVINRLKSEGSGTVERPSPFFFLKFFE